MADNEKTALIIAACVIAVIILIIVLFVVCRFCYKRGRCLFLLKRVKKDEETEKIISSKSGKPVKQPSTKSDFLIKRCDQESTRNIEELIIQRLKRDGMVVERPWIQDDGQQPVIVFCVISSRIGVDIDNAMRGVHDDSCVILVLLHCHSKELLTGDLSDDDELLDATMKNRMKGIAHFAFSVVEGLYDCRQNTDGFNTLSALVNSL